MLLYYYDGQKKGVAHLWDETDTFCKLLTANPNTGSVTRNKLQRRICPSCQKRWSGWMGIADQPKQPYNGAITTL